MEICEKIKTLRKHYNLTQDQLSKKIKVERSYISRIENGDDNISAEVIRNIVIAFPEITADWLIDNTKGVVVLQDIGGKEVINYLQVNKRDKIFLVLRSLIKEKDQHYYNGVVDMMINDISIRFPKVVTEMKIKLLEY